LVQSTRKFGFILLILSLVFFQSGKTLAATGMTDYQRMSWLFYLANKNSVAESAALHFGILHSDILEGSADCTSLSPPSKENANAFNKLFREEFDVLKESIKPGNLSNKFSSVVTISNAYGKYDRQSQSLILDNLDQIQNFSSVNTSSGTKQIGDCNLLCSKLIELRAAANAQHLMPARYEIDLYTALQKAIMPIGVLTHLPSVSTSPQLNRIPIDEKLANELSNRQSSNQILDIHIDYRFFARRPFQETDALSRRNHPVRIRDLVIGFSLPTHSIEITNIRYVDKISGETLGAISFNESESNIDSPYSIQSEQIKITESSSVTKSRNKILPKGLRTHDDAIVVRANDIVFRKTPAENRLALTKLNQLLALSAGLPDLSDPDQGIYVADLLGKRATDYFEIADMRVVQPQTYNLQLNGDDQGLSVVIKWQEQLPEEKMQLFTNREIPLLEKNTLNFPINFMDVREVFIRPYDSNYQRFPLMLINGDNHMRLNDLRKPTIRLDAELPGPSPQHWNLSLPMAEIFVERYYRFHTESDNQRYLTGFKRLTLASTYQMNSVNANRGSIQADMKLLKRTLYLDDELTEILAELPTETH